MSTRVRLTDAKKFPLHGAKPPAKMKPSDKETWGRIRGKLITIGKRETRPSYWNCTSRYIWPVLSKSILKAVGKERAFVCRHQIQAGD